MPEKISEKRLRRIVRDAADTHAALVASNERQRAAQRRLQDAKLESQRLEDSIPAIARHSKVEEGIARHRARCAEAVADAQTALDAASDEAEDAFARWSATGALAAAAKTYADSIGQLPADLRTH